MKRALLALVVLAGCGGDGDANEPSAFVAFERDFQGFHAWRSFPLPMGSAQGMAHLDGMRTDYVDKLPPAGAKAFPVGTIIVKELANGDLPDRQVFAMVKRGGGYNDTGARGWEWFELRNRRDGSVAIVWQGVGPPSSESYGGDPAGGCNECHGHAAANDFVQSAPLMLGAVR